MPTTIGRNDPCHCGSGKKYKKCHLEKDQISDRQEREKAALNASKVAAREAKKQETPSQQTQPHTHPAHGKPSWVQKMAGKVGFFRNLTQRRTPSANKGG